MTRTRYTVDANTGLLLDRDGQALGRVVGITLEIPDGGTGGSNGSSLETANSQGTNRTEGGGAGEPPARPTATQLEREAIARIWAHWLEITGKRQRLDAKRTRIIRNALGLVGEEQVKRALLGLTRSPHHTGQNEQRKTYLEIRYALKGIGDESDDERIEKAITWAATYAPAGTQLDPAKVDRDLDAIRYTLSLEHRPERERAQQAWRRLTAAGFSIVRLDRTPWARLER